MRNIIGTPVLYRGSLNQFHGPAMVENSDPYFVDRFVLRLPCGEVLSRVRRNSFVVLPPIA